MGAATAGQHKLQMFTYLLAAAELRLGRPRETCRFGVVIGD